MIRMSSFRGLYRLYLGIAVACLVGAPAWAQFETRAIRPTAPYYGAFSIAAADFNNDGKVDIAVVYDNGFYVSLGYGDGTFAKPVSYKATAASIAAGDLQELRAGRRRARQA